ncbi:MAG TPA: hypothetical protein VMB48_07390 [Steroidobacteraceae bacterium]|nr:hypothetical protein [Steroidobacteraceae bacterium]
MNTEQASFRTSATGLVQPDRTLALLGCAALLALLAVAWFRFSYGYVEDDAFIHLEFARSVARGTGFAFHGTLTNGDTSPLWVLFLAAMHALGVEWIVAAKLACVVGLAATVSATWCLARALPRETPAHDLLPPAAVAVTVLNPYFAHWSFSGMEVTAAVGLSLWALWAVFAGRITLQRAVLASVLLSLGPLLRPELLVFAALVAPVLLWRLWSVGGGSRHRLLLAGGLAVLMLLPLTLWCAYALHAFGSVIPNTNLAKRGGALAQIAAHLVAVYAMGFPATLLLLPAAMIGLRLGHAPPVIWMLLAWPTACAAFYLADHTAVQTRYCLLSMPTLGIAVLWLLGRLRQRGWMAGAAAAMLLVSCFEIGWTVIPQVRNKVLGRERFAVVSAFINNHLPPSAPLAIFSIGQIGFESPHPLVDLGGITQPDIMPYAGDPAAMLRWARARGARYYSAGTPPEPNAVLVFGIRTPYVGWTLQRSQYTQAGGFLGIYRLP